MAFQQKILKNKAIYKYLAINYANLALNVALNLLLIRRLSTYNLGIVNIGRAIFNSFDLGHFGVRSGFDRVLPAIKNERKSTRMFSVGILSTLISSICFALFWVIYKKNQVGVFWPFIVAGVCSALVTLYRIFYRSKEDKTEFVRISLYTILIPTVFQVLAFLLWNLTGFIFSFLISYIMVFLFAGKDGHKIISFKDLKFSLTFRYLLDKGFLLYLASFVDFIISSADRFIVDKYMGLSAVGNFSVIMFFFSVFSVFSANYTELIMSKIIINRSLAYVKRHIAIMLVIMTITITAVYFVLPFFVNILMPKYVPLVSLMRLILLAILPFSIKPLLSYYLHSIDKRGLILITDLSCAIIYLVTSIYYLKEHKSLTGIIGLKIGYYTITVLITCLLAVFASSKKNKNNIAMFS